MDNLQPKDSLIKACLKILAGAFILMAAAWLLYTHFGHGLIRAMYEGRSIGVLNRIITGQQMFPVEYYFKVTDRLFIALISYLITPLLLYFILLQEIRSFIYGTLALAIFSLLTFVSLFGLDIRNVLSPMPPIEPYEYSDTGCAGSIMRTSKILYHLIGGQVELDKNKPTIISEYLQKVNKNGDYIYVVDYDPVIYYLSRAKIPTKYAFPPFLTRYPHIKLTGIDPVDELRSIMRKKPVYVICGIAEIRTDKQACAGFLRSSIIIYRTTII